MAIGIIRNIGGGETTVKFSVVSKWADATWNISDGVLSFARQGQYGQTTGGYPIGGATEVIKFNCNKACRIIIGDTSGASSQYYHYNIYLGDTLKGSTTRQSPVNYSIDLDAAGVVAITIYNDGLSNGSTNLQGQAIPL